MAMREIVCFLPSIPNSALATSTYACFAHSVSVRWDTLFRRRILTKGRRRLSVAVERAWGFLGFTTLGI